MIDDPAPLDLHVTTSRKIRALVPQCRAYVKLCRGATRKSAECRHLRDDINARFDEVLGHLLQSYTGPVAEEMLAALLGAEPPNMTDATILASLPPGLVPAAALHHLLRCGLPVMPRRLTHWRRMQDRYWPILQRL